MVMGKVWCAMVLGGVIASILQGRVGELTPALMEGAERAISLCLSMAGPLCLWSGAAKVVERAGLTQALGRRMAPVFRRLFPRASRDPITLGYITANVTANVLGLGNAATPMGVAAVGRMKGPGDEATDEMCRFVVLNTASLQLIPTTVAALRAAHGCETPLDILPAVWLTSAGALAVGLLTARLLEGRRRD